MNEPAASPFRELQNVTLVDITAKGIEGFEDKHFYLIDENGDADVAVQDASPDDEIDILEIDGDEAVVDLSYSIDYEADATYDDPDTQSYDSETGTVMSWAPKKQRLDAMNMRGSK